MLDVLGALSLGMILAACVAALIGLAAIRPAAKFTAFAIAAVWTSLILGVAAMGGFEQGVTGPVPTPVIAFLILIVGGVAAWFALPAFRNALLSLPLAALVSLNATRVVGVCFLILHHQGRLAAPFATSAGWGDVITGLAAIPLAGMTAWNGKLPRGLLALWNAFGALDLVAAIALGALSAPGTPFQVFTQAPSTAVMGTLPWVAIPTLLVPLYLLTHLTIAVRLWSMGKGHANLPQAASTRRAA